MGMKKPPLIKVSLYPVLTGNKSPTIMLCCIFYVGEKHSKLYTFYNCLERGKSNLVTIGNDVATVLFGEGRASE
ncbi:hypothetical protein AN161_17485 [Lysinibacillus sp. FJAT-14222]|nr:hypothetical protein AN161_17485 [Lysinibacillus sp. FJAT-14222]